MRQRHTIAAMRRLVVPGIATILAVMPTLYAAEHSTMCPDGSAPLHSLSLHFSGDSYRPTSNCGPGQACDDRLVFAGSGVLQGTFCVGQTVTAGSVVASGSFAHYEVTPPNTPGQDIPLKFTGTWKATKLESFQLLGLLGTDAAGNYPLAAGVAVMDIVLVRPSTPAIPLTRVPSLLALVSTLKTWPGTTVSSSAIPVIPSAFSCGGTPLCSITNPAQNGVYLVAPYPGGYSFEPIPIASEPRPVPALPTEAHTPVVFGTLNENRDEPPN
jgi:hypothetical protein